MGAGPELIHDEPCRVAKSRRFKLERGSREITIRVVLRRASRRACGQNRSVSGFDDLERSRNRNVLARADSGATFLKGKSAGSGTRAMLQAGWLRLLGTNRTEGAGVSGVPVVFNWQQGYSPRSFSSPSPPQPQTALFLQSPPPSLTFSLLLLLSPSLAQFH
jgi:hypothetical protein